jgi:hypothetical protein
MGRCESEEMRRWRDKRLKESTLPRLRVTYSVRAVMNSPLPRHSKCRISLSCYSVLWIIAAGDWSQGVNRVIFRKAKMVNFEVTNSPLATCKLRRGCTEISHTRVHDDIEPIEYAGRVGRTLRACGFPSCSQSLPL